MLLLETREHEKFIFSLGIFLLFELSKHTSGYLEEFFCR